MEITTVNDHEGPEHCLHLPVRPAGELPGGAGTAVKYSPQHRSAFTSACLNLRVQRGGATLPETERPGTELFDHGATNETTSQGEAVLFLLSNDDDSSRGLANPLRENGFSVVVSRPEHFRAQRFRELNGGLLLVEADVPVPAAAALGTPETATTPIPIIVVGRRTSDEIVQALEHNVEDWIVNTSRAREVVARVRAVLRRQGSPDQPTRMLLRIGEVCLDPAGPELVVSGASVPLTAREYKVLGLLMANAGRVVPKSQLLERAWGGAAGGSSKALTEMVRRLRAKLTIQPSVRSPIVTVRGVGYLYEDDGTG